jgi:hypothetical protein
METRNVNSLGYSYPVEVPSTYEEFDTMAGAKNAALGEAISNVIYRGTNADFRSAFLDAIETLLVENFGDAYARKEFDTGKAKKTVDEDGNEVEEPVVTLEKEGVYEKRVIAQLVEAGELASDAKEVKQAYFQSIIDEVMSSTDEDGKPLVAFDPKQRERKVVSKRIPKYIYSTIDALIGLGVDAVANAAAKLAGELNIEVDPANRESLARALHLRESSKNKELERAKALAS